MERVAIGSRYANYAAELLRTPSAFKARSAATFGLRSPLAIVDNRLRNKIVDRIIWIAPRRSRRRNVVPQRGSGNSQGKIKLV